MNIDKYRVTEKNRADLAVFDHCKPERDLSKKELRFLMKKNTKKISALQDKLYAEGKVGILIVFQAMDAAGKDGAIKHVMSGVNPQGVNVTSFKQPSSRELSHDYLWRAVLALPPRGKIAIFNRSYYEDVLIVKVHKLYEHQLLPDRMKNEDIISQRYKHIRDFEDYLWENGILTVKFFLHLSKDEQHRRFLKRLDRKDKNWKFSHGDLKEREYWDAYQDAYKIAIQETATDRNPWYVVPADRKAYTRAVISEVLVDVMRAIGPSYPEVSDQQKADLAECKEQLVKEEEERSGRDRFD